MSLLVAGALFKSGERIRGPFGNAVIGDGSFTPSGDEWDAAEAVFTATGGSGFIYLFNDESLRATQAGPDGISSGVIGYANDYLAPSSASAAVAEGDRRPTLTTIDGVTYATFDGVDDEMLAPFVDWATGTLLIFSRMTSAANANQTAFEVGPLRIMAQFTGKTGPCVRVGNAVLEEFGLSSMLNRHTIKAVQFSRTANTLRLWYDGSPAWVEADVASWDDNPHESWTRGLVSILGHNSFNYETTGGAPITGGIHALIAINTDAVTVAQVQSLGELAALDTGVVVNVPPYPSGGAGEPGTDELPAPVTEVTLNNQTEFNNWKALPPPAGQHATCTFNVNLGTLAMALGTEANPIVIKADSILGRTAVPGDVTGDNIRLWGFDCGNTAFGEITGENFWLIRCKMTGASTSVRARPKASGFRAWYCEMSGNARQIAFDTGANAGGAGKMGINGHVKGCHFHDVAPGLPNATETITVGFSSNRTFVESNTLIEDCLLEDCNLGGQEDETIAIKSSKVTVRNCTLNRCRFVQNRHGTGNRIERVVVLNSPTGGISVFDGEPGEPNIVTSCKTDGSQMRVYAGDTLAAGDDPDWWQAPGANQPRAHSVQVYHHNAIGTAPAIGYAFSNYNRPALNTDWLQNRGVAPNKLGTGTNGPRQTGTNEAGTAPIAHVAPVKLTAADVGPNAATGGPTVAALFARPFSSASAFNRPMGSGATFSATAPFAGDTNGTVADDNVFSCQSVLATADPVANFVWSGLLSGVGLPFSVRFPATGFPTYTTDPAYDSAVTVVDADGIGHDIYKVDTRAGVRKAAIHRAFDIRGLGHGSEPGFENRAGASGAGNVVFAGLIRKAEFETPGAVIGHAHQIAIPWAGPFYMSNRWQAPAVCHDGFGETNSPSAPCNIGDLLAIKSADLAAVLTLIDGLAISSTAKEMCGRYATAFCHYGIIVVDSAGQLSFRADAVLDGTLKAAFVTFIRSILWTYLYRVTNSITGSPGTITTGAVLVGDGGTLTYPAGGGTALAANTALV